jgi:UDP-N-acetylmuramate dehydrogenase
LIIQENFSLKNFNTFGIDAAAQYFVAPANNEEITEALNFAKQNNLKILPIGKGSNILFTSDFDGITIHQKTDEITVIKEDESSATIESSAGVEWDKLVEFTVDNGLWGLENLSLIPGTAGAAPIQNIGAYGTELKEHLIWVKGVSSVNFTKQRYSNKKCEFGYRDSIFKHRLKNDFIITSIALKLSKLPNPKLSYRPLKKVFANKKNVDQKEIRDAIIKIRTQKLSDPNKIGNAGSFFKNPVVSINMVKELKLKFPQLPVFEFGKHEYKIPAGWLIENAGMKGYLEGNVGVSNKQALVLVNYGNATGKEVLELAEKIKNLILKKFNISLQTEVNIL